MTMAAVLSALFFFGLQSWPIALAAPRDIITSSIFNQLFPNRNGFYTYDAFVNAASSYPAFGNTGANDVQKRELAAYFANVKQETGSLMFIREINQNNNYCDRSNGIACPAGEKAYYGRGPLQLTWNYNYNAAGNALSLPLLANPDLLATDATDSFRSSLWYWNSGSNCHNDITRGNGFGATIRDINGAIECGKGSETQQASNRISYYKDICSKVGVDPGPNLGCA